MKTTNFKLVKIDTTQNWNPDFLNKLGTKQVYTWYIFDANRTVNCCEILPSYELLPVYESPDNESQLSDTDFDEFSDLSGLNLIDDCIYIHCSSVDKMNPKELPSEFKMVYEYDEEKEIDYSWDCATEAVAMFQQGYQHLL